MLMTLKKFRAYLYGIHFIIECDANTVVAQLNRPVTDIPNAVVQRWIAWIRMFDFTVVHVPGNKNTAADGLSRKPPTPTSIQEAEENDIEEFLDRQFNCMYYVGASHFSKGEGTADAESETSEPDWLSPDEFWTDESLQIAKFLQTLRRPEGMDNTQYRRFRHKATDFLVQDGYLFKRMGRNQPVRRVVDDQGKRKAILKALHDESGHRGRESTYQKVRAQYWWNGLWEEVKEWC